LQISLHSKMVILLMNQYNIFENAIYDL